MNNLCIVTSYIDINRGQWNNFKRTNESYINAFKPYLTFPEDIILFIDNRLYKSLEEIINNSGKKNIKIISIDDKFLKENITSWNYISRENEIMKSDKYRKITINRRKYPENNIPEYNVVQHCKLDFIKYVIENKLTECEYICWSDFGYFMNPEKIPKEYNGFNTYMIDRNKINYCSINNIIDEYDDNIMRTLVYPRETIGGFFFIGRKEMHLEFNKLYKEVLENDFYKNNLVDDDQHIVLRCYFRNKNLFKLWNIGWHNTYNHFKY